jgi:DNA-directed RNA polymerase subunit RPC12/RpoP
MAIFKVTPEAKNLFDRLIDNGLFAELEYWDGHKHVDIHIPSAKLYIEVDGAQHFTNPDQIASDFLRDHYSDDAGYSTFRIPNAIIKEKIDTIVKAILKIITERHEKLSLDTTSLTTATKNTDVATEAPPSEKFLTTKLCYKCRKCSLEFAVYTNYPTEWGDRLPYCPECGIKAEEPLLLAVHEDEASLSSIIYNKGVM